MTQVAEIQDRPARETPEAVYALLKLAGLVRRRWAIIAGCGLLFGTLAAVAVALQAPAYRATADLLLDPKGLQVVGRDIERADSSASLSLVNVDSQALVLTSTPVLRRVADKLDLTADRDFQVQPGLVARLLDLRKGREAEERVSDAVEILRKKIGVRRVDGSLVFQITATARQPARAADIANAVAASYLQQVVRERIDAVQRAGGSLVDQVSTLRAQLEAADAAVERFRTEHALIRTSDTDLVVTQQLKDLYTQISTAEADLAKVKARRDQVAKISPADLLSGMLPGSLSVPTVTALRAQYAQTARDLASLGQTLMPQHPRIIEVRAELAETRRLIKDELARIQSYTAEEHAQASANLANLRARAKELTQSKITSSAAEIKLRGLESEADAIRAVFNAALGRSRELEQQQRIETQNSRILSEATAPAKPSNISLPIAFLAGVLLGVCLGGGLAYLVEVVPLRPRRPALPGRRGAARARLTARQAAKLLGVDLAIAMPPALSPSDEAAGRRPRSANLIPLARALQSRLGARLPAVVMVAVLPDDAWGGEVENQLAAVLSDLGEDVLVCGRADSAGAVAVHSVSARTPSAEREFVLARYNPRRDSAIVADAVVLAVDLARIGEAELTEAASVLRGTGQPIVALAAREAAPGRLRKPGPAIEGSVVAVGQAS